MSKRYTRKLQNSHWWMMYIDALKENKELEEKIKMLQKRIKELEDEISKLK